VKKEDNLTSIENVENSGYTNDEVLLNAIGTSTFENIKEKNIIFEGWTDYEIFKKALSFGRRNYTPCINNLKEYGAIFAHGAPSIRNITPIIKLCNKKVIIFTDADKGSNDAKKSFEKQDPETKWITFSDINSNHNNYTIEDFIKNDLLNKAALESNIDVNFEDKPDNKTVMKYIGNAEKENKENFKNYIANNITRDDIKREYFDTLKELNESIKNI
jgi:hypothetical protein